MRTGDRKWALTRTLRLFPSYVASPNPTEQRFFRLSGGWNVPFWRYPHMRWRASTVGRTGPSHGSLLPGRYLWLASLTSRGLRPFGPSQNSSRAGVHSIKEEEPGAAGVGEDGPEEGPGRRAQR
jgi:hypothetical protein